jgi:hypothetical protein
VFLRDPTRAGCINVDIMIMKKLVIGLSSLFFASSVFAALPKDTSGEVYHKEWLWSAIEKAKADNKSVEKGAVTMLPPGKGLPVTMLPPGKGLPVTMLPPGKGLIIVAMLPPAKGLPIVPILALR